MILLYWSLNGCIRHIVFFNLLIRYYVSTFEFCCVLLTVSSLKYITKVNTREWYSCNISSNIIFVVRNISPSSSDVDCYLSLTTLIARFMGPTWGPSGADRAQVGPMLAPWTLLSGKAVWGYKWILHTHELGDIFSRWCDAGTQAVLPMKAHLSFESCAFNGEKVHFSIMSIQWCMALAKMMLAWCFWYKKNIRFRLQKNF